jgi:hypothetical protein
VIRCALCSEPILDPRKAYRRIVGWERPGRGIHDRSGSSLVLREPVEGLAHPECIVAEQNRVNVAQGALV